MEINLESDRLSLKPISSNDFEFIKNLVNTDSWIKFIGERNIQSIEDSKNYIQKIIDNQNVIYWIVNQKKSNIPVGIITFIKREYLEFHDLGFAFLPVFEKNGYAFEASNSVLDHLKIDKVHRSILATTIPENQKSI